MIKIAKQLTMSQAAARLGVTRQRVHQLISQYQLRTTPINPRLTLIAESQLALIPQRRKVGRPKKA